MDRPTGIHCLCQHFASWYMALKEDSTPDFAAPCESCKYLEYCAKLGFPWDSLILPLLAEQGIAIMVRQELQAAEGIVPTDPDADIRNRFHN